MTRLVYVPVYGFFLLPLAGLPGNNADSEKAPAVEEKQGSCPQNPLSVSIDLTDRNAGCPGGAACAVKDLSNQVEGTFHLPHREDAEQDAHQKWSLVKG